MQSATPFMMFQGSARQALDLYTSLMPEAKVEDLTHFPEGDKVMMATLVLKGQRFRVNDSPIKHAFTFTPSFSIFIDCEDDAELERLYTGLSEGGAVLMALDNHGFSRRFGWVVDPYGISWQLNLPG